MRHKIKLKQNVCIALFLLRIHSKHILFSLGPNKKSEVLDTARSMLEACERQVIAGQDGADTLLRRDKKILGAQLVHNDSIFGRFYRDSGPKADKIVARTTFLGTPRNVVRHSFCKEEREALLFLSFFFARPLSGAFAKSWGNRRCRFMTLLGNFVRTREQGEQRMYWRSMNGMRSSSRTHSFLMKTLILASHASSAPFVPFERIMFFLSGHLYKISQQSHKGPPIHSPPPSPLRMVMGLSLG